ncbi:hypothetical protein [Aliiroseovarius crassostreae]|uniref:hypothetical protein n=1 Tax=Aliiroseovarius crassostreae TaxID=154981 RepID=UPI00220A1052|nr:hypothetical protein [Aliiroseovarius crassostreae]UWQ00403.1 hypothetical protein K3X53_15510 [Aliiroseovarius crassostreae]
MKRPLVTVLLAISLLLILGLWVRVDEIEQLGAETDRLQAQTARVSRQLAQEQAAEGTLPSQAEIDALAQRIHWYNDRIPARTLDLPAILDGLEQGIGPDVRLGGLTYDRAGEFVQLSILSETEQTLLATLHKLRDILAPNQFAVERQITLDGASGRLVQYDLRVMP